MVRKWDCQSRSWLETWTKIYLTMPELDGYRGYLDYLKVNLETAHEVAGKKTRKNVKVCKDCYDVQASWQEFEVGQPVWLYRPQRKKWVCPKLQCKWDKGYVITCKLDDVLHWVQKGKGRSCVYNNWCSTRDRVHQPGGNLGSHELLQSLLVNCDWFGFNKRPFFCLPLLEIVTQLAMLPGITSGSEEGGLGSIRKYNHEYRQVIWLSRNKDWPQGIKEIVDLITPLLLWHSELGEKGDCGLNLDPHGSFGGVISSWMMVLGLQ